MKLVQKQRPIIPTRCFRKHIIAKCIFRRSGRCTLFRNTLNNIVMVTQYWFQSMQWFTFTVNSWDSKDKWEHVRFVWSGTSRYLDMVYHHIYFTCNALIITMTVQKLLSIAKTCNKKINSSSFFILDVVIVVTLHEILWKSVSFNPISLKIRLQLYCNYIFYNIWRYLSIQFYITATVSQLMVMITW